MTAAVYMANTISAEWKEMSLTFNLAMLVMLLCVAAMYYIQTRLKEQDTGAAKNSLITIITFGEGVVGMTDFFDVRNFSLRPVLVFVVILALFGCYVIQIHYLCNHHRTDRSLRLMFSHYFIVIAVNLETAAFKFLENEEADRLFTAILMAAALLLFFTAVFADSAYYYERFSLAAGNIALSAAFLVTGAVIMVIGRNNMYAFLMGTLTAVSGNFGMLLLKYKKGNIAL